MSVSDCNVDAMVEDAEIMNDGNVKTEHAYQLLPISVISALLLHLKNSTSLTANIKLLLYL